MSTLYSVLLAIDVLLAVALIAIVLLQHGKGADAGAAVGSGATAPVFGARGSASFLSRVTTILAASFFANSLALAYLASHEPATESVIEKTLTEETIEATPAESTGSAEDSSATTEAAESIPQDMPTGETAVEGEGPQSEVDRTPEDVPQ